jgi:hypothetical protein
MDIFIAKKAEHVNKDNYNSLSIFDNNRDPCLAES